MKELKLMKLTLKNFKGCKEFTLDLNGSNADVYGPNEGGKTTLADAFYWVLFNKDSKNLTDFSIKTQDATGSVIHKLEHEVEADFLVSGQPLTLRKVYSEDWTRKKGDITESFSGHSTDYFVNGVPKKKKEYVEVVDSIVPEELFKLLTSPTYFNEQMKWQDRRAKLIEVCGDVSVADVIGSNGKLKDLPEILNGRKIEDHKLAVASRRSKINAELKEIPVRITEIHNLIPADITDVAELEYKVSEIEKKLDENATQINNIKNGVAITGKKQSVQRIEMELAAIKRDYESDSIAKVHQMKSKMQEEQSNLSIMKSEARSIADTMTRNDARIAELTSEKKALIQEYNAIKEEVFTHNTECACPTCGQELPPEQLEAAKTKAEERFNLSKSQRMEKIMAKGKEYQPRINALVEENTNHSAKLAKNKDYSHAKEVAIKKLDEVLADLQANIKDVSESVAYQSKKKELDTLNGEIAALTENTAEAVSSVEKEIVTLRAERAELNTKIAQSNVAESSKIRIAELDEQQQVLSAEFMKLEKELFLMDEFTKTQVELLTAKINSKFKLARFMLFKTNINGGIEPTCQTLYKGVDYDKGLNNAGRINVGLDICSTLQNHYGIKVPTWIDNRESVVDLLESDMQVISLIVSGEDKNLRVELDSKLREVI